MLNTISKVIIGRRLQKLLHKYQITVLHYLPGRIRLVSPLWKHDAHFLSRLLQALQEEKRIHSVSYTEETGSLLIIYDATPVNDMAQIEQWFTLLDEITKELVLKERGRHA